LWGFQSIAPSRSGHEIAERVMREGADVPVYLVSTHMPSLAFYLARPVTLVDYRGEMALGMDAEPDKGIADRGRFAERWRAPEEALAIFSNEDLVRYRDMLHLEYRVLYSGYRRTLVSNRLHDGT